MAIFMFMRLSTGDFVYYRRHGGYYKCFALSSVVAAVSAASSSFLVPTAGTAVTTGASRFLLL